MDYLDFFSDLIPTTPSLSCLYSKFMDRFRWLVDKYINGELMTIREDFILRAYLIEYFSYLCESKPLPDYIISNKQLIDYMLDLGYDPL